MLSFKKKDDRPLQDSYLFHGLPISIEFKAGSLRERKNGSTTMVHDYGYIRNTVGADNEAIDVYVGPDQKARHVYIVKQHDLGKMQEWNSVYCPQCFELSDDCACPEFFDEDKVMLGFTSKSDARKAYLAHYDKPGFLGPISTMTVEDFKALINTTRKGEKTDIPLKFAIESLTNFKEIFDDSTSMIMDKAVRGSKKPPAAFNLIEKANTMDGLEAAFMASVERPEKALASMMRKHFQAISSVSTDESSINFSNLGVAVDAVAAIQRSRAKELAISSGVYTEVNQFNADYRLALGYLLRDDITQRIGREKAEFFKSNGKKQLVGLVYDENGNELESLKSKQKTYDDLTNKITELSKIKRNLVLMQNQQEYNIDRRNRLKSNPQNSIVSWKDTPEGVEYINAESGIRVAEEARNNLYTDLGAAAISKIIEQSPISEKQAIEWARKQTVTTSAKSRLRKQGYSIHQLYIDMAEHYRLTHGRMPEFSIVTKGDRRANACIESSEVRLDSNFTKSTLFHEMSHLLERDIAVRLASYEHWNERTAGEEYQKLSKLTGNNFYKSDELAKPDKFFDVYMGKVYSGKLTEVLSMGIQEFASAERAGMLLKNDPQTFEYIVGVLSGVTDDDREKVFADELLVALKQGGEIALPDSAPGDNLPEIPKR